MTDNIFFHIFKTSVSDSIEIKKVQSFLDKNLSIEQWNFDLEDCDKILRIESKIDVSQSIEEYFKSQNIYCEELF